MNRDESLARLPGPFVDRTRRSDVTRMNAEIDRTLAGGSVLEERVFAGTPNEMVTMYYDKDADLELIRKRKPGFVQPTEPGSDPNRTATVERVPDEEALKLEQHWNEEWQKNLVDVAIDRVKRIVSDKQFQIFDLYVLKEWSVTDVKRMLHVSTAQVYLAKHRFAALLKKELRRLKGKIV
jgi:hypothetical protein